MKISKFQFGNKVPKPSENFIKQKLGYGATSTLGTAQQKAQQNQAAQQAQLRTDYGKYLKALKEGQNWAVTKSVQNRAMNPGSIKALPKDYKIEDGHIPTQEEINKEVELRQDPIKGAGLRWNESWENNTNPVKAILKSGILYANPYTGALNAVYNLANSETGVGATYNAFKNGDYLQGAVNGAFNLVDAGMMGNGVNKIAQKLIPSYELYSAIKNGTIQSEKLSPKINNNFLDNTVGKNNFDFSRRFSSTEMPKRLQIDPSQTYSLYKKPISLDYIVNESLPSKFKKERFTDEDLAMNYKEGELPDMSQMIFGFDNLESTKRWQFLNSIKEAAEGVGIKNPSLSGQINVNNRKYRGVLINGDNVKDRGIDLNSPQMKLMREQYARLQPEEFQDEARQFFNEGVGSLPSVKRYFTYSDADRGVGGFFDPDTRTATINLRYNSTPTDAMSTFIHEVNSHGTDDFFQNTNVQTQYENLLKDLGSNLPWYELRATLNELKNRITSIGNLTQLKDKLDTMSDNTFMRKLRNTNAYGINIVDSFDKFKDGSFVRPDLVKRLKWATATLPAATPVIMNKGNSE